MCNVTYLDLKKVLMLRRSLNKIFTQVRLLDCPGMMNEREKFYFVRYGMRRILLNLSSFNYKRFFVQVLFLRTKWTDICQQRMVGKMSCDRRLSPAKCR